MVSSRSLDVGTWAETIRVSWIAQVIFFLRDYNLITLPFPPSIYSFHSPSNSWPLFKKLIVIACIYVYTNIFLNITSLVHILLPVRMFSGWSFGSRQSIGVLFPWEDHFSHFQLSSVAYSSFVRLRPHRLFFFFSCPVCHVHWCHPGSACIWTVMLVRLDGCSV